MNILWKESILALLIIGPTTVSANIFKLPKTSARFTLEIRKEKLSYRSEHMQETLQVNKCNFELVKDLNNSFLRKTPTLVSKGLDFQIDQHQLKLDPKDPYTLDLLNMDERMISFFLEEKQLCQR